MSTHTNVFSRERLLNLREVRFLTGKGRSGIYAEMRINPPKFPRPIKDGCSSRWLESEVIAWMNVRVAARDAKVAA